MKNCSCFSEMSSRTFVIWKIKINVVLSTEKGGLECSKRQQQLVNSDNIISFPVNFCFASLYKRLFKRL